MSDKTAKIKIIDDYGRQTAFQQVYLREDTWKETVKDNVIAFLEEQIPFITDPIQEDINRISVLIRSCLEEAKDIVANELDGGSMTADARAERTESLGALIYFKLTERPRGIAQVSGSD